MSPHTRSILLYEACSAGFVKFLPVVEKLDATLLIVEMSSPWPGFSSSPFRMIQRANKATMYIQEYTFD
jgi:hypothetical protein